MLWGHNDFLLSLCKDVQCSQSVFAFGVAMVVCTTQYSSSDTVAGDPLTPPKIDLNSGLWKTHVSSESSVDCSRTTDSPQNCREAEDGDRRDAVARPWRWAGLLLVAKTFYCRDCRRCFSANPQGENEENALMPSTFRWVILSFCVALIATTGAAIFNWVDLRIMLTRNGAMVDRCSDNASQQEELRAKGQCDEQKKSLDDAFNIGVVFIKLTGLVTGPMLDIAGPRYTGIFGLVVFSSGILCLGLNLVLPGVICIGAACNPIFNCAICVGNLFPEHKSLVISILSAAGDLCTMNFLIMRLLSDAFGDRVLPKVWILCYISVPVAFGVVSMKVLPRSSFLSVASETDSSTNYSSHEIEEGDCSSDVAEEGSETTGNITTTTAAGDKTVWRCFQAKAWQDLKTPHFWCFLLFFMLLYFKKINYMRNVEDFLRSMTEANSEDRLKIYMTTYSAVLCIASIFSIVMGIIADVWGMPLMLFVVNGFSCAFSGLSLVSSLATQIVTFVCFAAFNSFILSSLYCFVVDTFGYEHVGFITGIQQVIAGLFCMLNIPFQSYIVRRQWWINHVVLLGLSVISFVIPIYLLFIPPPHKYRKAKRLTGLQ